MARKGYTPEQIQQSKEVVFQVEFGSPCIFL